MNNSKTLPSESSLRDQPVVATAPIDAAGAAETEVEADESTRLLGAGAGLANGANGSSKDTWVGYEDFEGLTWWRRPSVFWLLGPYFLFTLAFGGIIVPKINLIIDLVCRRYFADQALADPNFVFAPVLLGGDNPQCFDPLVQRKVTVFTLALSLVTGTLSAVVAPKLGHMSDRFGRKRLMAVASCGGLLAEAITIIAAKYPDVVSYQWLILGATFDGLTGSFTAGSVLSHSYTSDCTPPSKRGVSIGYLHAALFSGLAFGPLLAGYFVSWTGSLLSIFYVTLGCHTFFILFILFVLPESLSKKKQQLAGEKHAQEQEAISRGSTSSWLAGLRASNPFAPLRILVPRGPGSSPALRRNMIFLATIDTILLGAAMGAMTVILLYSETQFGWRTKESSAFISALSLVRVVVLMIIFPVVNYFLRMRPLAQQRRASAVPIVESNAGADVLDTWIIRFALTSDILGVMGYVFARSGGVFVASGIVTALGGLGSATIQAALTKHVPPEMVGQLLGATGLLHASARVLAPIAFNGVYYATLDRFPQAIFVLLASLFGVGFLSSLFVRPHVYLKEPPNGEAAANGEGSYRDVPIASEGVEEEGIIDIS